MKYAVLALPRSLAYVTYVCQKNVLDRELVDLLNELPVFEASN
jgi:hypothetical protein